MAEEYINQGGVCSGNWWNPSMNMLFGGGFSPCSGAASDMTSFGWPAESKFGGPATSASSDWTQAVLFGGGGASDGIRAPDPSNIMHESGSSDSSQIQNDWSPGLTGNFASKPVEDHGDSMPIGAFKNQIHYPAQSSDNFANYDVSSSSGYPSSMIKSFLLDQPAPSLFENRTNLPAVEYSSGLVPGYGLSCSSPLLKPINSSLANPTQPGRLHFSNSTPYWNASMAALDDIRASLLGSEQLTLSGSSLDEKPNRSNLIRKANSQYSQASGTAEKKVSPEPASKRPRIETPLPLPTFKVRKEKLGDRITALQQLVSPFGKTDTASVLYEAIEYIKFLHDQVNTLSTPYMKSGSPFQHQQQGFTDKAVKATERPQTDLRSRGLCLVPISSTFPVTCETPGEIWTPTFGGSSFR